MKVSHRFRQVMLAFWAVGSLFWALAAANHFRLGEVAAAYRQFHWYQEQLVRSGRQDNLHAPYSAAARRAERMNGRIGGFIVVGGMMPLGVLFVGARLFRENEKRRQKK